MGQRQIMTAFYKFFIRSKIDNGIYNILGSESWIHANKIDIIQNKCLKCIIGVLQYTLPRFLCAERGFPLLQSRRNYFTDSFLLKSMSHLSSVLIKKCHKIKKIHLSITPVSISYTPWFFKSASKNLYSQVSKTQWFRRSISILPLCSTTIPTTRKPFSFLQMDRRTNMASRLQLWSSLPPFYFHSLSHR